MRYQVIKQSATGHCCFEASVIDSTINRKGAIGVVCECFDNDSAYHICQALNEVEMRKKCPAPNVVEP